jgi:hypothetical protein
VTLCKTHFFALCAAAQGCGCCTEADAMGFLADCMESTLYFPVRLLAGDEIGDYCVCCAYAFPDEAIDAAVIGALALRRQYGGAAKLN